MHISRKYFSLINKIIVFIFILFIFNNTSFNYYSEIASNSNEKVAYLTFDDGHSKNTPLILDILKENDINVTLFIISPYIEEHINIVKKAFTEGNNIPASTLAQNICKEIKDKYGNYKTYVVPFIQEIIYKIKDKYGNYKTPAIILMHDCMTKTTTVEALSEIIKFLKNESYTFKTLK